MEVKNDACLLLRKLFIRGSTVFQCYVADKVHCVWLVDEEMKVLFDCKDFEGPGSASINAVVNKELIQEYLDTTEHIPHIRKVITLEPTLGLHVAK